MLLPPEVQPELTWCFLLAWAEYSSRSPFDVGISGLYKALTNYKLKARLKVTVPRYIHGLIFSTLGPA